MSSHIKHHHARASQELARPIGKASTEDSSVGEQGCGPNLEKICDPIDKKLSLAVDIVEKNWPKYDSKALKVHIKEFIKEHASHPATDDASKSDEKINREKTAKAKDHLYDKVVHKTLEIAKAKISHAKTHDHHDAKRLFHETKDVIKHEFGSQYQEVVDRVGAVVCEFYEEFKTDLCETVTYVGEVLKNDFSEVVTYVGEETEGLLTEVDDGATQALRKLVEQVACKFIIEVVNKWEERRERKEENEKYEFNFKGFIKLFKDAANFKANLDPKSVKPTNFYTDFDFDGFVELFQDATNFYTESDSKAVFKVPEDVVKAYTEFDLWGLVKLFKYATNFYTDFDVYAASGFEGFVELFEDEDDYVMVDRNTMMPSEITGKAAARTRTWWFFW